MPCIPCWQQRQLFMGAMRQGNPYQMWRVARQGAAIATDKLRGIDVTRKYAAPLTRSTVPVWRRPGA